MATSKKRKIFHLILAGFWTVVVGWMFWNMQARNLPPGVFEGDETVAVARADGEIRFSPVGDSAGVGLVFYPGALADPDAYAPLARGIAAAGYEVVVLELPFRLAPFDRHRRRLAERTLAVTGAPSGPSTWIIGGHSKGGKLAAEFAGDHPESVDGLLLIGTSHPRERDLSDLEMHVTKIFASEDGLASVAEVRRFAVNLPENTRFVLVDGGNHAGFGFYGRQIGDGTARISRSEQLDRTVDATLDLLRSMRERSPATR